MQGVGQDTNKICKMSRSMSKGILWGFTLRPKPIFPVLGPQNKDYSTLNLKPKPTPFMAFLEFHTWP
jgi:hypothetical protein